MDINIIQGDENEGSPHNVVSESQSNYSTSNKPIYLSSFSYI